MKETYTYTYTLSEKERAALRARRIAARKRRERERRRRLLLLTAVLVAAAALLVGTAVWLLARQSGEGETEPVSAAVSAPLPPEAPEEEPPAEPVPLQPPRQALAGPDTARIGAEVNSAYGVLIDLEQGVILAEKKTNALVSPASMTKILTILTAAEQLGGLTGTFTITQEITDYCYRNNCSVAGFVPGEEVALRDLFYGTILPSGADAALALACYVAGSHDAFVELMNQKAAELGLSSGARFANCVGLYDVDNVCTVYDMALILWAAMDNPLCRQVLGERTKVFPPNQTREAELNLSNWFIRRIEDHMPEGLQVLGAKTGYVSQSGSCAASLARDASGREYICVTAKAPGSWSCIMDHAALYGQYAAG